jgi:Holliday junction resolvase RusA-like endonuclease
MQSTPRVALSFTVPYLTPNSGNHYKTPIKYVGHDGNLHMGFKLTKETQAYYDAVSIFARGETVSPATEAERKNTRYDIRMEVFLGPKKRLDIDNALKVGVDALVRAHVIHTDAAVNTCTATIHRDERDNPRTVYHVTRLEKP